MSQYGAYGASSLGIDYRQILSSYYPGTALTTQKTRMLAVHLRQDDSVLEVPPAIASGLTVTTPRTAWSFAQLKLPASITYTYGRQRRAGAVTLWHVIGAGPNGHRYLSLQALVGTAWQNVAIPGAKAAPQVISFYTPARKVRIRLGSGGSTFVRDYPNSVSSMLPPGGSTPRTVNWVNLELYLQGVVPAEMPASWGAGALRSQAVAARTFALWESAHGSGGGVDVCDTSSCQVYKGLADYTTSGRLIDTNVVAASTAAVTATAGQVLTYRGQPILAQFSSSNGGRTAADPDRTHYPYLDSHDDPWDLKFHNSATSWTVRVTAASITAHWPAAGSPRSVTLTRDGQGTWGGRITAVRIEGSRGTVTVSGDTFRSAYGMKSTFWTPLS